MNMKMRPKLLTDYGPQTFELDLAFQDPKADSKYFIDDAHLSTLGQPDELKITDPFALDFDLVDQQIDSLNTDPSSADCQDDDCPQVICNDQDCLNQDKDECATIKCTISKGQDCHCECSQESDTEDNRLTEDIDQTTFFDDDYFVVFPKEQPKQWVDFPDETDNGSREVASDELDAQSEPEQISLFDQTFDEDISEEDLVID